MKTFGSDALERLGVPLDIFAHSLAHGPANRVWGHILRADRGRCDLHSDECFQIAFGRTAFAQNCAIAAQKGVAAAGPLHGYALRCHADNVTELAAALKV